MTCEVAVMNTRGVTLGADSAVTMSNGAEVEKIYLGAEKLFGLAPLPVGVMPYGEADPCGVPWKTIIGSCRRLLDTLREYLDGFIAFIEGATVLFREEAQRDQRVLHTGERSAFLAKNRYDT